MTAKPNQPSQQSKRFLFLYALAVSGGAVAYMPFLTILLPLQVTSISAANPLTVLAYITFAGAISASVGNIGFGWFSDLTKSRRPWIAGGLILSTLFLIAMQLATSPNMLIAMILGWQLCLNMMLAPLTAWAGDCVPDSQKGMLGGLLAIAPALGALSGAFITLPSFATSDQRLSIVAVMVIIMVGPVLVLGKPAPMPRLLDSRCSEQLPGKPAVAVSQAAIRMWLARLLVQVAEAALFAFLLLWFRSVDPGFRENTAANIFTVVLFVAVLVAILAGRWSDNASQPIIPLIICSAAAALGLLVMSATQSLSGAIAGYLIFGIASSVFLALHSSQTLRVLPRARTRGRDLGFFNLTNTVPSLIIPWITLALVPNYGFNALFTLLAGSALIACGLLITMPREI